ncbi:DNA polymerase V [Raoultella ornithinolytica]|jgi:DNA polymerase V|uniref:DNA polymerase V n=1 Tax=Raoultella ornithinolytica TaxID=54291 RepID=A0ABD7QP22_RAOOR|nr:DNA polymerase V [Raoultella ornithinolytica]
MGFESPAKDYIEDTLTVTKLCRVDANSKIVKTDSGYAILDLSLRPQPGDFVLIRYDGITDFGRLQGRSFITRDGEAIEGEGVEVYGVVTFSVNDLRQDKCPVI